MERNTIPPRSPEPRGRAPARTEQGHHVRKLIGILAVSAAAGGGLVALPTTALAKTCSAGYTHAVIGGEQKCLRRGEFCSVSEGRRYHRYGFNCEDVRGYERLEPRD